MGPCRRVGALGEHALAGVDGFKLGVKRSADKHQACDAQ